MDQAGCQPLRRHPQPDDHLLAGEDQGQGRYSQPVHPHDRHRADALRGDAASRRRRDLNGIQQKPIEGISFAYTFDDAKRQGPPNARSTSSWVATAASTTTAGWRRRHRLPRGSRRAGFDLDKAKWELYNIDEDFSQANDLATEYPLKFASCRISGGSKRPSTTCCRSTGAARERLNAELMGRPSLGGIARRWTYYPGQIGLPNEASPRDAQQVVDDHGRHRLARERRGHDRHARRDPGGYGLYLRDGKPTFVYNYLDLDRLTFTGTEPLPKGKTKLVVEFVYDGKRRAR